MCTECVTLCCKVSGVNGEQVFKIWCYRSHSLILVTGSSTWHLMAKNSLRIWKKRIVALHKDGVDYKKIAKPLKLSCSTVAKTIQRFNRTGSTKNRPRHGQPKKLSARAQHHIRGCVLEIAVWVLPALLLRLKGWGSACQCSDHTPHTALNWLSSQKEASSKDDVQESLLTVCWRQAD